jgi:hypothetical protein
VLPTFCLQLAAQHGRCSGHFTKGSAITGRANRNLQVILLGQQANLVEDDHDCGPTRRLATQLSARTGFGGKWLRNLETINSLIVSVEVVGERYAVAVSIIVSTRSNPIHSHCSEVLTLPQLTSHDWWSTGKLHSSFRCGDRKAKATTTGPS